MTTEHLVSSTDTRPQLHYSTIDIGPIAFSQRPENDSTIEVPGNSLRLSSRDASGYPMLRIEHHSRVPESTPPDDWDYQRVFQGVSIDAPVAVLSMFGDRYGELVLPEGNYGLRILHRREELPDEEEEVPEFHRRL
ncbi:hypothetical protein [Streptomyces triculaminicus]|uniref:hypothetical protein n=1 Tax=Streptomyces triculaminicus TaxID=2816232 RepID=UPI00379110AA